MLAMDIMLYTNKIYNGNTIAHNIENTYYLAINTKKSTL